MANIVAGDMYEKLDGQLFEIKRQIRQTNGYPHNPELLSRSLQRLIEGSFGEVEVEIDLLQLHQQPKIPDLTKTGKDFGLWLNARAELHRFLTGKTIVFQEMFEIPVEILTRTDIMPVFRPVGATNRMAMDWKVKLGMNTSYEEADVMRCKNSQGPKVPELYYINRSVRPDEDTLGDKAMSPNNLLLVPNKRWLGLYGWSDADNLHSLITGIHLDSGDTWTWFPNDRLPGAERVAYGCWVIGCAQAWFCWGCRSGRCPDIGVRVAIPIKLRT